jgi:hypothetical protein
MLKAKPDESPGEAGSSSKTRLDEASASRGDSSPPAQNGGEDREDYRPEAAFVDAEVPGFVSGKP